MLHQWIRPLALVSASLVCPTLLAADPGLLGPTACSIAIAGNGATAQSHSEGTCIGCAAAGEALAVDGNPITAAVVNITATLGGGMAIVGQAPKGTMYGGTRTVAATVAAPLYIHLDRKISIRTYLGGIQQEDSGAIADWDMQIGSQPGHQKSTFEFTTRKAFDAVEVFFSGDPGTQTVFELFEICADALP